MLQRISENKKKTNLQVIHSVEAMPAYGSCAKWCFGNTHVDCDFISILIHFVVFVVVCRMFVFLIGVRLRFRFSICKFFSSFHGFLSNVQKQKQNKHSNNMQNIMSVMDPVVISPRFVVHQQMKCFLCVLLSLLRICRALTMACVWE